MFKTTESRATASPLMREYSSKDIIYRAQDMFDANKALERAMTKKLSLYSTDGCSKLSNAASKSALKKKSSKNFISMNKDKVKGSLMDYAKSIRTKPATTIEKLSSQLSKACSGRTSR